MRPQRRQRRNIILSETDINELEELQIQEGFRAFNVRNIIILYYK